jgi:anti-sigma regulatory factor (Ser/Thr protein kinase)
MDNKPHQSFHIQDPSKCSAVKKTIRLLAESIGFVPKKLAQIDIVVSEILTNLIKHSTSGREILVKHFIRDGEAGLEIICIDDGPGIADVPKMMVDGVSTTKTLGHGLGAIKRLSDTFEIYSTKGWGTILLVRFYKNEHKPHGSVPAVKIGSIMVPYPGESLCGDGWVYKLSENNLKVLMVDGLGHGAEAYLAAQQAIEFFNQSDEDSPALMLKEIHKNIRQTRGAVGAMINIDLKQSKLQFCGIGNISGRLVNFVNSRVFMSYNGIMGHNIPNRVFDRELEISNGLIILCSDGIKERWDLKMHPLLSKYDISITAAVIYKENNRKTDDVSALVFKIKV